MGGDTGVVRWSSTVEPECGSKWPAGGVIFKAKQRV